MRTSQLSRILWRAKKRGRVIITVLVSSGLAISFGVSGASSSQNSRTRSVVISTTKNAKFGTILVDGTTLYTMTTGVAKCTTSCHKFWIEVLLPKGVTKATAGPGVNAAKLGTVKGTKGALQVTYDGKALFWFSLDKIGRVTGNVTDTWGKWSDVVLTKPAAKKPSTTTTTKPPKSTTTSIAHDPTTTTTAPKSTTTTTAPKSTTTTVPAGGGGVGF